MLRIHLGCVQTDAILLTNNSQHCWMLHVASVCTPCCMLLDVVVWSLKPVKLFSKHLPTFLLFRDRRSVAQQCWIRCTALPTLLGPRTLITHSLQRLMGCILPNIVETELLHPFAHHCQHVRNNSQHCWRNNVESCCVRLHAALRKFDSLYVWSVTHSLLPCSTD